MGDYAYFTRYSSEWFVIAGNGLGSLSQWQDGSIVKPLRIFQPAVLDFANGESVSDPR